MEKSDSQKQKFSRHWAQISPGAKCFYGSGAPDARKHKEWMQAMLREAKARRIGVEKAVEMGAGRATVSQYLAAKGIDCTCVDYCNSAGRVIVENFTKHGMQPPEIVIEDIRHTSLMSGAFDLVCSFGTLEHFEDVSEVITECNRLSRGFNYHVVLQPSRRKGGKFRAWDVEPPSYATVEDLGGYIEAWMWDATDLCSTG